MDIVGRAGNSCFIIGVYAFIGASQEEGSGVRRVNPPIERFGFRIKRLKRRCRGKKIVGEVEASVLVDRITQEAKSCLLDIKSASQKEIRAIEDGYHVLPLQLEIESSFEQLGVFLGRLDSLEDGLVSVDSFQILGPERLGPKVSAFLSLNLYLQKDLTVE